jgi:hypothetical protein
VKRFAFLATLLLAGVVHAQEPYQAFLDRPLFMSAWLPDSIPCVFDAAHNVNTCMAPDVPLKVTVRLTTLDGKEQTEMSWPTLNKIRCPKNTCEGVDGLAAGSLSDHPEAGDSVWIVTQNYYLASQQGKVVAWRHGKGPMAEQYLEPLIYSETPRLKPTASLTSN